MKCEICKKAAAQEAIETGDGKELYVCHKCAETERLRDHVREQNARRLVEMGMDDAAEAYLSGQELPSEITDMIFEDLANIAGKLTSELDKIANNGNSRRRQKGKKAKHSVFPMSEIDDRLCVRDRLHLEGLNLMGELNSAIRAMHATDIELIPVEAESIKDVAHAFRVEYTCSDRRAKEMIRELVSQEMAARKLLAGKLRIVLEDSVQRALAILKNCRLVTAAEMVDLISPVYLASLEGMISGMMHPTVRKLINSELNVEEHDRLDPAARDAMDSELAKHVNRTFAKVNFKVKR